MKTDVLEFYLDAALRWRWRYRAQNGNILADSGQSYSRRIDAVRAARRVVGTRLSRRVVVKVQPDARTDR